MKRFGRLAAGLVAGWMAAGAQAEPLDLKAVPADAKWVVHLDMDATRQSQLWKMVMGRADKESGGEASRKLAAVSTLLGSRFPEDVHGVTLVGRGFGDKSGVLLVRAKMDRERLTALVKLNEGYATSAHDGREIASWRDGNKGQTMYGSFATDSLLVVGPSADEVRTELDVLSGKAKSFAGEGPLAEAAGKGVGAMLYIGADMLADLQKKEGASPILAQLNSAWLSVAETPTDLQVRASVNAKSAEAAGQLRSTVEGFKALALLAGGGGGPEQRFVADAVGKATLAVNGSTMTLDWPMSLETVRGAIENANPGARRAGHRQATGGEN